MAEVNEQNLRRIMDVLARSVDEVAAQSVAVNQPDRRALLVGKADGLEHALGVIGDYFELEGYGNRRNAREMMI